MDHPPNPDTNADWGFNGTNEFQFFDTIITSVVLENGTESKQDQAVGCEIIQNIDEPFPKLTDLDVDVQDKSTIYGMKFGVNCKSASPSTKQEVAFYGNWTRSVIAQDMWPRLKCYKSDNSGSELYQDSFPFGSQGTTFLTDIDWGDLENSVVLKQLKNAVGTGGKLSIRISVFYYTRNYPPYVAINATLGYVVGTIGIATSRDTLNFGGERLLSPNREVPLEIEDDFDENDLCKGQDLSDYATWMSNAPFEVDKIKKEVRVDLSNSLPVNLHNSLRDLKQLQLGILNTLSSGTCVHLLGVDGIPYLTEGWLQNTGGIYAFHLEDFEVSMLENSPLVLVQVVSSNQGSTLICGELPSTKGQHSAQILLDENPYFIRPYDYYVRRMEFGDSTTQTLYVTYFGKPASGTTIQLVPNPNAGNPPNGVQPAQLTGTTDSDGLVTFTFTVPEEIPYPREYNDAQCNPKTKTLPIDGQVYKFKYCLAEDASCNIDYKDMHTSELAFLAFSTMKYTEPYDWVNDVQPILAQYARLVPIMKTILDLSSYVDVTKSWNIHLMNLSMNLDFEDPGYMPTTRDLSPTKRLMILKWLESPIYSLKSKSTPQTELPEEVGCLDEDSSSARSFSTAYFKPPRCLLKKIAFTEEPRERDSYFEDIFDDENNVASLVARKLQRPLFGLKEVKEAFRNNKLNDIKLEHYVEKCTKIDLQGQLQTAIQLEFATIPLYLTALYSIRDGCNREIYALIRSVVIQEMLHMTQAANTLIATGGTPIVDSADTAPSYPGRGLPGGVLPKLYFYLSRLSLPHVYNVFMGIETPQQSLVGGPIKGVNTIGDFYDEIKECINYLVEIGENPFDPTTVDKQIMWPWDATEDVGTVFPVLDKESAIRGIEEVVTQGEGANLVNPNDIANNSLAHFFKFEEIVCQNKLVQVDKYHYAYAGLPIPFNPNGVWPMRSMRFEHSSENIKPNTNCYTESKAFHHAYRAFLRKLQETFSGNPAMITDAVELMETMQVHAKKLMWTKFRPNSWLNDRTCGPVWEYEWPDIMNN